MYKVRLNQMKKQKSCFAVIHRLGDVDTWIISEIKASEKRYVIQLRTKMSFHT